MDNISINALRTAAEITGRILVQTILKYKPSRLNRKGLLVLGTTTLDGDPFQPNSTIFPWADAHLIPVPSLSAGKTVITFQVEVTANSGIISCKAELQTVNFPTATSNEKITYLTAVGACSRFYTMTTSTPEGYNPRQNPKLG